MTGQLAQRALFPAGNRTAYSLLELLLAMSLLLGLLAVAWGFAGNLSGTLSSVAGGWLLECRQCILQGVAGAGHVASRLATD
jgi:hypothetical protein